MWTIRIPDDVAIVIDSASLARSIAGKCPEIADIAGFRPKHGTIAGPAARCSGNFIPVVDVTSTAVVPAGEHAEIADARALRPKESSPAARAGGISSHMTLPINGRRLSAVVARQ